MSSRTKSVAVIGAGAAGAVTTAALASEDVFEVIRVFERRESPGGTWIYDSDPGAPVDLHPGKLPPDVDPPLKIPKKLPQLTTPSSQQRYDKTPIYAELTTNVPDIAMSFSDQPFPYGPFVPHWIPKQYIESYFSTHRIDQYLVLNTTVEDVSRISGKSKDHDDRWNLTLRRYDPTRQVDIWWEEEFDAVIFANGHYSVPFVPEVKGLEEYITKFPHRISHSKAFRRADLYTNKRILIIGNSASGHDITTELVKSGKPKMPVYQSRRTPGRWDGESPPEGVKWKPVITEYDSSRGEIRFEDGSILTNIDAVIYCTGYKPSFPFWNENANGGPIYDYEEGRLLHNYQHTFSRLYPKNLGFVGLPRVLTFRSFEYQAIALSRLFSGRTTKSLPPKQEQEEWEKERAALVKRERRKFHDVPWDNDETMDWFKELFELAGLPLLEGDGRCPPVLGKETRWAVEHVRKYPDPPKEDEEERGWVVVHNVRKERDSLYFI